MYVLYIFFLCQLKEHSLTVCTELRMRWVAVFVATAVFFGKYCCAFLQYTYNF